MKQSYNHSPLFSTPETSSSPIGTGKVEAQHQRASQRDIPVMAGWLPPYNEAPDTAGWLSSTGLAGDIPSLALRDGLLFPNGPAFVAIIRPLLRWLVKFLFTSLYRI